MARALDKNLTLASQRITPETWDLQIASYLANYKPNLTSQYSTQNAVQLNTNPVRASRLDAERSARSRSAPRLNGGIALNVAPATPPRSR